MILAVQLDVRAENAESQGNLVNVETRIVCRVDHFSKLPSMPGETEKENPDKPPDG